MPDGHAKPIEVIVRQFAENLYIDIVFSKTLRVLGHAELFEPVGNLFHCAPANNADNLNTAAYRSRLTRPRFPARKGFGAGQS